MHLSLARKKIGFWPQVALIFFTVSGGAYGIEALVGAVGTKWTMILVLALPVCWALPIALMVAELSSALPEQGGYYVWVRRGLGRFWGFQEGWWTLCYSAVDMALYPVLFVKYLSFFFPYLNGETPAAMAVRWALCALFIALALLFNLRGSYLVGVNALANLAVVSLPFIILTIWGVFTGSWERLLEGITNPAPVSTGAAEIAAGLAIVLWNYCGWDNVSTYAEECKDPQRNYPRALATTMVMVVASYAFPILAGFKATISPSDWSESAGWPTIAAQLGGPWLGAFTAFAALLSAWAMFNSQLLYVSHLPSAMARDGWLPQAFAKASPKTGAPVATLAILSVAAAAFSALSLTKLMVVDIIFYGMGLSLEFAALIALRRREPKLHRGFRIPLGTKGLALMSAPPLFLALAVAVFSTQGEFGSWLQVGLVGLGVLAGLLVFERRRRGSVLQSPAPHAAG